MANEVQELQDMIFDELTRDRERSLEAPILEDCGWLAASAAAMWWGSAAPNSGCSSTRRARRVSIIDSIDASCEGAAGV